MSEHAPEISGDNQTPLKKIQRAMILRAMILAAGLGTRLRPITLERPKPLVAVGGVTMLDHALTRLKHVGVEHVVINMHYLADQIIAHTAKLSSPKITLSDERGILLETGGGIKKALPLLTSEPGSAPFWLMNSDSLWLEKQDQALTNMKAFWNPQQMDILLLLANRATSLGYDGSGDFHLSDEKQLSRKGAAKNAPYIYAGVAILKPELFDNTPSDAFSLNILFDRALEKKRLYGFELDGTWLHVGTPQGLEDAERVIKEYSKQSANVNNTCT